MRHSQVLYKLCGALKAGLQLLHSRKSGGALYIAIIISIVTGITLCMFIAIAGFNQRYVSDCLRSIRLDYELRSAFELGASAYFTGPQSNRWFDAGNNDSMKIKRTYWGAYLLIQASAKSGLRQVSQCGLYGVAMDAATGLVTEDNGRPVGLSGNIRLKANCYLPSGGIKPAYIEGMSYYGAPGNQAFIKKAPQKLPEISAELLQGLREQQSVTSLFEDSLVYNLPALCHNGFSNKTLAWQTPEDFRLKDCRLKGNIRIISGNLVVDSSCRLSDVVIVCDRVRFREGFSGSVHVIARDSISAEKGCYFNFPSSFALVPEENNAMGFKCIELKDDCHFFGGILACDPAADAPGNAGVFVKLSKGCEVNGLLYSEKYLHLQSTLNATAMCRKLLLKTASAVYENHILACDINPAKWSKVLAVPKLFLKDARLVCCGKMN